MQEDPNSITCNKISEVIDKIYKYNCSVNVSGDIIKIEITGSNLELNQTDAVKAMCKNIQELSDNLISDKGIFTIYNCKIVHQEKSIILQGRLDEKISKVNSTLRVLDNNKNLKTIPMEITAQDNNNYKLEIIYKEALKSNLNESFGKVDNGKNFFLFFEKDADPLVYYKGYSDNYKYYNSKSNKSDGLSLGAIVVIIISCVLLIVLVILLVFNFRKKLNSSISPMENISSTNNTIGINSSNDKVNK